MSKQMMNRIHSSAPSAAAGSAMAAIGLMNVLTPLAVMLSFLSIKAFFGAITKTFSSPQKPYQTVGSILLIALIGAFLQAGFMWGGKLLISPMAIFFMTATLLLFVTTYERISALENASAIFVHGATTSTILSWLICGGAAWLIFHFDREIVNVFWMFIENQTMAKAIAHISSAILLVLIFIQIISWNVYLNARGNTEKYFMSNLEAFANSHNEQEVNTWLNNGAFMMQSVLPIIRKSTPVGGGTFAIILYSVITALIYSFIAWYFGHFNIAAYNTSLF